MDSQWFSKDHANTKFPKECHCVKKAVSQAMVCPKIVPKLRTDNHEASQISKTVQEPKQYIPLTVTNCHRIQ